jgi:hypothetical protein
MSTTLAQPITRASATADVLAYVKADPLILAECSRFEVIGAWVWVWFAGKPTDDCRASLKAAGFHWNQTRHVWQHTGGRRSRKTGADAWYLRGKYGAQLVKGDD